MELMQLTALVLLVIRHAQLAMMEAAHHACHARAGPIFSMVNAHRLAQLDTLSMRVSVKCARHAIMVITALVDAQASMILLAAHGWFARRVNTR